MRPASIFGSFFALSLTCSLGLTVSGSAWGAPPSSDGAVSARSSGVSSRSKASRSKASPSTARKKASHSGKGLTAGAADATSATSAAPDDDPWEGRGAPESEADPGAAEPPPLLPEPPPEEPPMDPRTAYHKGNAAFRDGRFTAARHYYRRALEGDTSFDVLCNLGRAEAELKDNVPAWVHLSFCLDAYPRDPELQATRASFGKLREEVETQLTAEQQVRADELYKMGPPKPVVKEEAKRPVVVAPPPPPPDVDLGPKNRGLRNALSFTLGGLALAGIGGGVGLYVYSTDLGKEADALRDGISGSDTPSCPEHPNCAELSDTLKQSDDMQQIALGGFIAGGGLAAAAVLTYVLWPHEYGPAKSAARPTHTAGLPLHHLRPLGTFDPARGSMWLGLRGQF